MANFYNRYLSVIAFFTVFIISDPVIGQTSDFTVAEYNLDIEVDDFIFGDLLNNDSLQLVVAGRKSDGSTVLALFSTTNNLQLIEEHTLEDMSSIKIEAHDIDNDQSLELVIQSTTSIGQYFDILKRKEGIGFETIGMNLPQLIGSFLVADINNDGRLDLVGREESANITEQFLYINDGNSFTPCTDCDIELLGSVETVLDNNKNGYYDLITTEALPGGNKFYMFPDYSHLDSGSVLLSVLPLTSPRIQVADYSSNGESDLLIAGELDGLDTLVLYAQTEDFDFEMTMSFPIEGAINDFITADYNNDGKLDLITSEGDVVFYYELDSGRIISKTEITSNLDDVQFTSGDIDRDYDQDIVISGTRNNDAFIIIITNENHLNTLPINSQALYAFPRGDSVMLTWEFGSDSSTPTRSLTYNIFMRNELGESMFPAHSRVHRSISNFGAQIHSRTYVLKDLQNGIYDWDVQTIDNSLVGPVCLGGGGQCLSPGGCFYRFAIAAGEEVVHDLCAGETIDISLPSNRSVLWFSNILGPLEDTDTLRYTATENDIVYANYIDDECISRTYVEYIEVYEQPYIAFNDITACEQDEISLTVGDEFESVAWVFAISGNIFNSTTLDFTAAESDTIFVTVSTINGCQASDTILLTVNPLPVIETSENRTIINGTSVQLIATGGEFYSWTPAGSLNSAAIANPIANPSSTVTYTVEGTDSLGCSSTAKVMLTVEQGVYVPNLFSPNGDGDNDYFEMYGNGIARGELQVFDMVGKLLYSGNFGVGPGWDGTYNGKPMPQGNYVWSISGSYNSGAAFREVGPTTGQFTLVR